MSKIKNIQQHVRNVLKKAGVYRPEMSYQIELLASDLALWRKFRDESLETPSTVVEERKDYSVTKVHPIHSMVQAQANQLRQDLKALLMNWEKRDTRKADEAPDEEDLMSQMFAAANDDD